MPIIKGEYKRCVGCKRDGWQKGLGCSGCNRNPIVLEKLKDLYKEEVPSMEEMKKVGCSFALNNPRAIKKVI